MKRSLMVMAGVAAMLTGCGRRPGPDVAATVNNRPVTYPDLEKFYKRQFVPNTDGSSEDQKQTQKLEILRTMIDAEIMLQRAEKEGLMATDSEVDMELTELRAPYTREEFDKSMKQQGMTLDDLRTQIRRELSPQKLVNKDIVSHITISDADVTAYYNTNKTAFNFPEPQLRIAQIVVTPQPDPNTRNLRNNKAQTPDEARSKIDHLAQLLKQGDDFAQLAQNFSEDPGTAPNGGDLGYVAESALDKANPELKKLILAMNPGQITGIITTPDGYRVFKMISKEPAGQRELTDPRVQQSIRNLLMNRKDQLLRAAYLEVARSEARVANYFAKQILDRAGKPKR